MGRLIHGFEPQDTHNAGCGAHSVGVSWCMQIDSRRARGGGPQLIDRRRRPAAPPRLAHSQSRLFCVLKPTPHTANRLTHRPTTSTDRLYRHSGRSSPHRCRRPRGPQPSIDPPHQANARQCVPPASHFKTHDPASPCSPAFGPRGPSNTPSCTSTRWWRCSRQGYSRRTRGLPPWSGRSVRTLLSQ